MRAWATLPLQLSTYVSMCFTRLVTLISVVRGVRVRGWVGHDHDRSILTAVRTQYPGYIQYVVDFWIMYNHLQIHAVRATFHTVLSVRISGQSTMPVPPFHCVDGTAKCTRAFPDNR